MTVSLEAMSVGRPVVATRTPGMEDYVVDGQTGYLVDPGDSSELAAKVLHLLDNPAAAAAMGERGRSRVLERHTTDTMCAQLRDILTSF
jgi:glycosyltransferase involved in cell wall biosynthesis